MKAKTPWVTPDLCVTPMQLFFRLDFNIFIHCQILNFAEATGAAGAAELRNVFFFLQLLIQCKNEIWWKSLYQLHNYKDLVVYSCPQK